LKEEEQQKQYKDEQERGSRSETVRKERARVSINVHPIITSFIRGRKELGLVLMSILLSQAS